MNSVPTSPLPLTAIRVSDRHKKAGFGLTEVLMVVAILGVITALALPSLAGVLQGGRSAKAKQQAQAIAQTYAAAEAVGAVFAIQSREGVVDALTRPQGVAGIGIFENVIFSVKLTLAEQNEVRNSPFLVGRTLPDGKFHLDFKP